MQSASLEDAPTESTADKKAGNLDEEARKKEAKAAAKEEKLAKKKNASKLVIKREQRNKRKYVTAIVGLEHFGGSSFVRLCGD